MKKKIIFTNGHLNTGGCEKSLVNLLNSIDYEKYEVDLLLFEDVGGYAKDLNSAVNIELLDLKGTYGSIKSVFFKSIQKRYISDIIKKLILFLGSKINKRFLYFLKLFKNNKFKKYDIAVAYRVGVSADFVTYAVNSHKKYVWWHHGIFEPFLNYKKDIKKNFEASNKIVCVSNAVKKMLKPYFPNFSDKFTTIPNIVIKEEIIKKADEFTPYGYLKDNNTIIVSVSRFAPEKHMENIVFVVENLLSKGYNNFVWYIVGDGKKYEETKSLVLDKGLTDYIIFLGNQNNPYPYIKKADIFVHLSPIESQGIAVIEAMALNKICVVNRSLGTEEYVINGINAIQTENNVESMTEKVGYAIDNNHSLDFSTSQNETLKQFSPENVVRKFYSLFED